MRNKQGQFAKQRKAYTKKDIGTVLLHMLDGLLIAYLVKSKDIGLIILGCMIFVGFLVYEIREERKLADGDYKDILGCLVGLGIYAIYPVVLMLWEKYRVYPL